MPKVDTKLECPSCRHKFAPAKTYKLSSIDLNYKFQLFMDGICPKCNSDALAWIGITFKGKFEGYFPISVKHSKKWYNRLDADMKKHREKFRVDKNKFSGHRVETVTGSLYDMRSGKYSYRDNITVR